MGVELLNIDCMEYMATQEDNSFDLAIVDPPYGLNKDLKGGSSGFSGKSLNDLVRKGWDKRPPPEYWGELFRISNEQIIWGGNYFLDYLPPTKCFISWDKMNGTNDMADFELAWTSFDSACRRFSMHHFSAGYDKKIHPTQKPVKLYNWILNKYAGKEQRILDTHLGSGSSAVSAHYFGCDFVGCEIDGDYFEATKKRFKKETAQLSLF